MNNDSYAHQANRVLDDRPGAAEDSWADCVNLTGRSARPAWDARLMQIEALLFVAAEPVALGAVSRALDCSLAEVEALVPALRAYFDGRGLRLLEHAGQLQLVSAPELTPLLERFLGASQPSRLSSAALEVLAIIAYRQPITRAQIEAIRGVDSSGVVRSLLARELIDEVGRAVTLGRPILYATTRTFLQVFGIEQLDALPELELPQVPDEPA